MIEWLRTTIPGIIILGAIGSILAVVVLRVCRSLLIRLLKPLGIRIASVAVFFFRVEHHIIEYLRSSSDVRELITTCTVFLAVLILWACLTLASLMLLLVGVLISTLAPNDFNGPILTFAGSFSAFSFAILWQTELRAILQLYYLYMEKVDRE